MKIPRLKISIHKHAKNIHFIRLLLYNSIILLCAKFRYIHPARA